MQEEQIRQLLEQISRGEIDAAEGIERLRYLPFEDIGIAQIDHHRDLRQGHPEVVFGQGKSVQQLIRIIGSIAGRKGDLLVTRLEKSAAEEILAACPSTEYHSEAHCLTMASAGREKAGRGKILVISAGTSDIPVASEALVTARFLGNEVEHLFDVGVAGIHRILSRIELLRSATVLIVVAGMEGALPSVVGGLVDRPVIAVPTSVGYGAAFGGIAALLGMLNSCASGVTVVNIDNGFGAACAASRINRI